MPLFIILFLRFAELNYTTGNSSGEGYYVSNYVMETSEFLTGKNNYYTDTNFVEIPEHMAYRKKMFLLKDTYSAYYKMYSAAKKEGINLKIISASRTFEEQKLIWEDKWEKNKNTYPDVGKRLEFIMRYNAMPATSRHHWGTDIDLNSSSSKYFATGYGKQVYDWLAKNAGTYGFCQTYNEKGIARTVGYNEEEWHWSYYPIANKLQNKYKEMVKYSDIKGFSGDSAAVKLEVIDNYVVSISNDCQ